MDPNQYITAATNYAFNLSVANPIFNPSVAVAYTIYVLPVISIVLLLGSSSSPLAQRSIAFGADNVIAYLYCTSIL
jgi:hypothetical protein